jgi:hypothetical protein
MASVSDVRTNKNVEGYGELMPVLGFIEAQKLFVQFVGGYA